MIPFLRTAGRYTPDEIYSRALDSWRRASQAAADRWQHYLTTGSASRPRAFGAYVAALDAEEAAADELARLRFGAAA